MARVNIRAIHKNDQAWITQLLRQSWGSTLVISRGRSHQADRLPGFIAALDGQNVGLATYELRAEECELVTLNSLLNQRGIGSALIAAVLEAATLAGCRRLWLITTNDNLQALGFYQKRGFRLVTVHANAVTRSRLLKPEIPDIGMHRIPLRDEIELEIVINP